MGKAKTDDTVKVHYTGKLDDGSVFDSSEGRDPIEFKLGTHQVIPGFEDAVTGMEQGESKTVRIEAEQAYGPFRDELVMEVERDQFPEDAELTTGQKFNASTRDGQTMVLTIVEAVEDKVTVDANHPLAGKDLTFEMQLVEIL